MTTNKQLGIDLLKILEAERGEVISDSADMTGTAAMWAIMNADRVREMVREIQKGKDELPTRI